MTKDKKAFLIHYDGYYDLRLKFVEENLTKNGYDVSLIFSDFDHFSKSRKSYMNKNLKLIHVPSYNKNISVKRIFSYLSFTHQVLKMINEEKPNLIYAIIPPNTLVKSLAAYKIKDKNVQLIFDIFDLYPEQMPRLSHSILADQWKKLRNNYLGSADFVLLECKYYQKILKAHLLENQNAVLYLNKPMIKEHYQFEWNENLINFAYLGSINHHIDMNKLCLLLEKINQLKPVLLHIIGDGENTDVLMRQLQEANIAYVNYGKLFDFEKKKQILQKCQYGLNIYRENLGIGLTMKSIDYFQIGLPFINCGIYDTGAIFLSRQDSLIHLFEVETEQDMNLLADRISTINKEEWFRLHEEISDIFIDNFSDERYQIQLENIMEKITDGFIKV